MEEHARQVVDRAGPIPPEVAAEIRSLLWPESITARRPSHQTQTRQQHQESGARSNQLPANQAGYARVPKSLPPPTGGELHKPPDVECYIIGVKQHGCASTFVMVATLEEAQAQLAQFATVGPVEQN
ncbi:hypothetical protein Pen01_40710 [Phytomonospora endophytica]|nr:hypothetical protein Pen01_40710 [Phytomonospora endophytica]